MLVWSTLALAQVTPPRLTAGATTRPPYPAAGDGGAARVVLELVVDPEGAVSSAELVSVDRPAETAGPFVDAAMGHAQRLWLEPATRDGVPESARVQLELLFVPRLVAPELPRPVGPEPPEAEPTPVAAAGEPEFGAEAVVDAPEVRPVLAASDDRIETDRFALVPRTRGADLLTLAPGVVLQNHSGEGHAPTIFLRGFDAGEGQDLAIDVEGVPLNEPSNAHGHGYADLYFVIPETVQRVRVLEGPFDPRRGDFALAGSASYRLGPERRGIVAKIGLGSFGHQRLLLMAAPAQVERGTFAAVDLRRGDGFGPNRAHRSVSGLSQVRHRFGRTTLSVLAGTSALEMDAVGVVREDAVVARSLSCDPDRHSQFFCFHDPQQGGSGSRHLASLRIDRRLNRGRLSQQLFLTQRKLRMRENFTGALLDPRGDGLDEHTRTTTVGGRGSYRRRWRWRGRTQSVEVGYDARHDTGRTRQWRLRQDGGQPYAVVFDTDLQITAVGAYLAAHVEPLAWLWLDLGLRADAFAFQLVDRDRASSDREGERLTEEAVDAFGVALQPRATIGARLGQGVALLLAAGRGVRSSDAQALSEGERAPFADVFGTELGLVVRRERGAWSGEAKAIGFYTYVSNDLVFDPERGRNAPVGSSQRYGGSLVGRLHGPWLDVSLATTVTEALLGGGVFALGRDERLPFVPRAVGRADVAAHDHVEIRGERFQWGLGLGAGLVGPKPLPLGQRSAPIVSVDLSARLGWRWLGVTFAVENVLDARNRAIELYYPSDFGGGSLRAARHFAAAAPRTFRVTFEVALDTAAAEDSP
ncbi:MAG: TonB-dependent receptor plug domain-containing protein [Deltaproteobacteria bacterium]|nr:TonB-dependent receptor plug domain-containing protein [Deltaproteobacteria bacterium]